MQKFCSSPAHYHARHENLKVLHDLRYFVVYYQFKSYYFFPFINFYKRPFSRVINPVMYINSYHARVPDPCFMDVALIGKYEGGGHRVYRFADFLFVIAYRRDDYRYLFGRGANLVQNPHGDQCRRLPVILAVYDISYIMQIPGYSRKFRKGRRISQVQQYILRYGRDQAYMPETVLGVADRSEIVVCRFYKMVDKVVVFYLIKRYSRIMDASGSLNGSLLTLLHGRGSFLCYLAYRALCNLDFNAFSYPDFQNIALD